MESKKNEIERCIIKEILVPVENSELVEMSHISSMFAGLQSDEFTIDFNDSMVEIQLAALDYNYFQFTANNAMLSDTLNENSKKVVRSILNAVSNIKSYGLKSGKRVYVDYNNERKVQNRKEKEEKRQQFYYTKGNNFSKVNTKLPSEYENQILCGDSKEILQKLPDNCIDLVVTSPPYNFGLDYASSTDDSHWETYNKQTIYKAV